MENTDSIVNKIKSALRLARRASTDGERDAAEAAAKRLADRYGIALETVEVQDSQVKTGIAVDKDWRTRTGVEIGYCSGILHKHFGVILIQETYGNKVRFKWIGTAVNIDVAHYAFDIMFRESRKAWREISAVKREASSLLDMIRRSGTRIGGASMKELHETARLNKNAYMSGWFSAIDRKLTANPLRNDVENFVAEKNAAESALEKYKEQNPKLKTSDGKKPDGDSAMSCSLGYSAGSKVNLSRPVASSGRTATPMIGA